MKKDGGQRDNVFILLKQQRFLPFFITQFLGAFNDNVFKNALIIFIAFRVVQPGDVSTDVDFLINLSAGLFILPFFLFSATAGQWIDKNEKSRSMRLIKLMEIVIMAAAAYAFFLGDIYTLIALLFMMGIQSAFFGPAKYSYIPQHLDDSELVAGNALVQAGTFVAILVGTMLGGILIGSDNGSQWVAVTIVVLAVLGYLSSRFIPLTPSVQPDLKINWNPVTETWRNIAFMRKNRVVFLSVLGVSWFWFLGATYLVQLPNYTKLTLGGNEQVVTFLLTLFTLGIGGGSLLCNRLSDHKIELGLVPFGSIGLTLFGLDLYFAQPEMMPLAMMGFVEFVSQAGSIRVLADVFLIGLFGGFYIVPLFALIQQRSEPHHLSRIIAGNNILNAFLMVLSAVMAMVLLGSGVSIAELFLTVALLNAVVAIYIYTLVPEFFMRFIVWILIHTLYRVRKQGLDNIPREGAALLVCNHVSYVDALIIAGCIRRPVRFVMHYKIYNIPLLHFLFKTAGVIPIAGKHTEPELLEQAFSEVAKTLNRGELVCIFPEGKLSRDGRLHKFRPGVERILKTTPVPVVPMALNGLWGSAFSRHPATIYRRIMKGIRSHVELIVLPPLPADKADAQSLQHQVEQVVHEELNRF